MKRFINLVLIVGGLAIEAFAVEAFVLPNNFLIGGVTGLGRFFNHYFNISVSLAVGIISVILLIIAWLSLGRKFAMTIIFGTFLFPLFLNIFQRIPAITHLTHDSIISALFGGALAGLGLGLVIKAGASSGGSDVIPVILNRKFKWPLAPMVYLSDFIILLMQALFSDTEQILLGILLIFTCSAILNKIVLIGSSDVQFMIISDKYNEINKALQEEIVVGTSRLHSTSGHLGKDMDIILCIVSHEEVYEVKNKVLEIDPVAFMTMINVNDVKGKGFSMGRM